MTRREIVEQLAKVALVGDLTLLTFDEAKIVDLWERDEINFFIARILMNQYQSVKSPFYALYRKRQRKQVPIEDYMDIADE